VLGLGVSAVRIVVAGHGDEIGLMLRDITDDGFVKLTRIGGSDRTVTRGQHVTVHTDDGALDGVIGQVAIHLRDSGDDEYNEIEEQYVDIGVEDGEEAEDRVDIGDPITLTTRVTDLADDRVAARGMDNRVGIWTAAETFRRAVQADAKATVYAISTVQEEVGLKGAQMIGFDLEPDAVVAVDVTHATDQPESPGDKGSGVDLGDGPVVARGSANHPAIVEAVRSSREDPRVEVGVSPRGCQQLFEAARGYACLAGRVFVTPDDIKTVAIEALAHRLVLTADATVDGQSGATVISDIFEALPVPGGRTRA
jgi:endoglucanase